MSTMKVSDLNVTWGSLNVRIAHSAASRDLTINSDFTDPMLRFLVAIWFIGLCKQARVFLFAQFVKNSHANNAQHPGDSTNRFFAKA